MCRIVVDFEAGTQFLWSHTLEIPPLLCLMSNLARYPGQDPLY